MWLDPSNPQLNKNGELHHLLSLEGLPPEILWQILDTAQSFVGVTQREVKKVPLLRGKAVFNLFFEPSTRTRTTFEIAAKRLSADVINLAITISSATKGESVLDTVGRHRHQLRMSAPTPGSGAAGPPRARSEDDADGGEAQEGRDGREGRRFRWGERLGA